MNWLKSSSPRNLHILRATLGYGACACLWILLSDPLLSQLDNIASIVWLSKVKGLLFVMVSTLFLFFALRGVPNRERPAAVGSKPEVNSSPLKLSLPLVYLLAVVFSLMMLLIRSGLGATYGQRPLLILFMLPIILSAMLGGKGPGLVATAITALGVNFLGISPQFSLRIDAPLDLFQWGVLVANGLLVSWLSEMLHRALRRIAAERQLQSVILSSVGDGVITLDDHGRVAFMNREAERLIGRDIKRVVGHPLRTLFEDDGAGDACHCWDPADIEAAVRDVLRFRTSMQIECAFPACHGTGEALSLVITVSLIEPSRRQSAGVVLALHSNTEQKRMAKALQESEQLLARVIEGSEQGFWDWNLSTKDFRVSSRSERMLGYEAGDRILTMDAWTQNIHPQDRLKAEAILKQHLRGELSHYEVEMRCRTKSGEWKWLQSRGKVMVRDDAGKPLIMSGTHSDITERKQTESALRQAAAVFENTQEGVVVTDPQVRILQVNQAFTRLTGYREDEVLGRNPSLLSAGRTDPDQYGQVWNQIAATGSWQGELWNRRKNGELYPELLSISAVKDDNGQVINYVGVFTDISGLKASEARLEFLAHHDPLTKLPNRLMLFSHLSHALAQCARQDSRLALMMLDLDRFKYVNDSFGHLVGDQLLQQVAERLSGRLRGADFIARLGGDEFTVLLEAVSRPEDAARVAEKIIELLQEPFHLSNGIEVRISTSIGISLYPEHGATPENLLQQADAAMYRAKGQGRGRFEYFSESMTQAARERILLDARLRKAIENHELCLHYQPQIDLATGRIVGAEALVRWLDPVEGMIAPARFIPIAEETGLIREIGLWVLEEACRQGRCWLDAGLAPLTLAVNVSAHQIHNGDFAQVIESVLSRTGYPSHRLELELTESALMAEGDEVAELLTRLQMHNIRLSIDDFGTGYSSLAYLKRFPLDVLKVDKSFVDDIAHDRDDREIVMAIINMGHTLGVKVLAEGVETHEQLAFLKNHGCDCYQGYLFSRPLPAEEFVQLLQAAGLPSQPVHDRQGGAQ